MPRGSLSLRASPGGLLVPVGCLVCRALEGFPVIVSCLSGPGGLSCHRVLSVGPWRAFLSSCPVCLALEGCPVIVSCLSGPGWLSCHVLSCLFSPGGLLIPPHFPMEILGGGSRVPAVGAGPRGSRPRAPKTICHGLQSSQLRHGPQSSQLRHGPQSSQLHHGLQSSLHRHGFQSSQLRHGPCLSVLLWRSPSCVPVCVCPEGPPERPPPLPDGTVKARDEPFGRGELCQSSVVCVMCPHLIFPYLVCFLALFNVIIS